MDFQANLGILNNLLQSFIERFQLLFFVVASDPEKVSLTGNVNFLHPSGKLCFVRLLAGGGGGGSGLNANFLNV